MERQSQTFAPGSEKGRRLFTLLFLTLIPTRVAFVKCLRVTTMKDLMKRMEHVGSSRESFPRGINWIARDDESMLFVRTHDKNTKKIAAFYLVILFSNNVYLFHYYYYYYY
jgi:hypothetical protein